LAITTTQTGTPYLSYSFIRGKGQLTLQMTNRGNGTAYNCLVSIISPANCPLNSSSLRSYTKSDEGDVYEIECDKEIPVKGYSNVILTFHPDEIGFSCVIKGSITYVEGTGKLLQTKINNFYPKTTTTIPPRIPEKKIGSFYIIVILIVAIMIIVEFVYLKSKKPELYAKATQPLKKIFEWIKKIFEKISQLIKKPKTENKSDNIE
jgi:hypothetical protein